MIPPARLLVVNLIFLVGSFLVRCAGCTWNDIVDQEFDRKVSRTQLRPIARRAITTFNALFFTVAQVLIGLALVVLLLPLQCLLLQRSLNSSDRPIPIRKAIHTLSTDYTRMRLLLGSFHGVSCLRS